jgi:hypothetical protein
MKSDEEIAREAAARLYPVVEEGKWKRWRVMDPDGDELERFEDRESAEHLAGLHRRPYEKEILAAIREAKAQVPGDAPVSEDRLAYLRWEHARSLHRRGKGPEPGRSPGEGTELGGSYEDDHEDFMMLVDHLLRVVGFLANETDGGYVRGYEEGFAAGRRGDGRNP